MLVLTVTFIFISGCSTLMLPHPKEEITSESYSRDKHKGVVVFSVTWARKWGCVNFQNAQLRAFGFDRMPIISRTESEPPDLLVEGSAMYAEPFPVNYALAVEPGEYSLSRLTIKVALSVRDVRIGSVGRSVLYKEGLPIGGTFDVKSNEIVYIGHFGLDCKEEPIIWRYYVEGREEFDKYKKAIKDQYRFLDVENMQFRLFRTSIFGQDYFLP